MIYPSGKIYISKSKIDNANRGVFSRVNIKKNETIEMCPVIETTNKDYSGLKKTILRNYYFMWNEKDKVSICLGFGSIYNHSYNPNATYKKRYKKSVIEFIAIKDIKKGEEITVNYNFGNPNDKSKLWIGDIPPAS